MTPTERLLLQLKFSRTFCDLALAEFKTPQQWTHQVFPGTNHALWFIGHIANTDNGIIGAIAPERKCEPPAFAEKFRAGTQPTNNPSDYPPPDGVVVYWRDRRETLLSVVEKLGDVDLAKPIPATHPLSARLPDVGALIAFIPYHEGMHAGQVTLVRRALNFKPVVDIPQNRPKS